MFEIRPYQSTDQNEIDSMLNEIASEFDLPISNPNKSTLKIIDKYWLVFNGSDVIGTVGILKINNTISILKNMFVTRKFRGKHFGVSKLLLNTIFEWCNDESVKFIYLGTMNQFKAAHKFYEKNGFQEIPMSELPLKFITNPIDDVFYKIILNHNH